MYKQFKSKARIASRGEVFTNEREVKAMCDLIPDDVWSDISAKFLEPSCGNGAFLVEILNRKLDRCQTGGDALEALNSICGVDIMQDNVEESKLRMWDIFIKRCAKFPATTGIIAAQILEKNIVCGDYLTGLDSSGKKIWFLPDDYCSDGARKGGDNDDWLMRKELKRGYLLNQ